MTCRIGATDVHVYTGTAFVLAFCVIIDEWTMLVAVLFAIVIHELGHAIMAKCLGVSIVAIDIMPCGGVLHMATYIKLSFRDDLALSIAGCVANLLAAMLCSLAINLGIQANMFITMFMRISFGLCLFNLFPASPLDGGRIFRSALALSMSSKKAGKVSAIIGYMLGASLCVIGIYLLSVGEYTIMPFIISYFVIIGTTEEHKNNAYVLIKNISHKNQILIKNGWIKNMQMTVYEDLPVSEVIKNFSLGKLHHITVVNENMSVVGQLDEKDIIDGATLRGAQTKVGMLLKNN